MECGVAEVVAGHCGVDEVVVLAVSCSSSSFSSSSYSYDFALIVFFYPGK